MTKSVFALSMLVWCWAPSLSQETIRPRLEDLGVEIGVFKRGNLNAITDVTGVRVGHVTIVQGEDIRTGVTAIVPHNGNLFQEKVPAAIFVGNGFGKLLGATQVEELGTVETPILLTNTLNVWEVASGIVQYILSLSGNENVRSVNPVVGETNDGFLNDIRGRHVKREGAVEAIRKATSGPVEEGCVGAGTGTTCFGWKGGIGTSSRILPPTMGGFTVGALVQTNFGGVLDFAGVPVGKELGRYAFKDGLKYTGDGSCMIVVATDAPLISAQLKRVAKRAALALGRTGSAMHHGSGDYVIAFSTSTDMRFLPNVERIAPSVRFKDEELSSLFQATMEATEEAIYNSLLKATTMKGFQGREVEALPIDSLKMVLRKYGRIP
ncbi:MAG: P1 family peptidase [Ignavibacteriales bacterium]|nr:P1 family peptidase [Ignavibacteriales bacterium]